LVVSCKFGQNEIVIGANHLDAPAPVNFGKELHRLLNAKRGGDIINLFQVNPQGTVLDFGDGATGGVMPARELQPVGKLVLRPTLLVALPGDEPVYEIALLHCLKDSMLSIAKCSQNRTK
jgi:hypothetical protein